MTRVSWKDIVPHAAAIVTSYDTGVTLRQCFYRLVSDGTLPNTNSYYKSLSSYTAEARRDGTFPDFIDETRDIIRPLSFSDASESLGWLKSVYRHDHTEGQPWSIYLGVEKRGLVKQLQSWFGDLGIPILPLGGYSSQTFVDDVFADKHAQDRPAVLLYGGDFDPSGEDIHRDFVERTGCFDKVVRVALTAEQVLEYRLPPQPGKRTDSRAAAFEERHGVLVQVELDALPPDVLRELYAEAISDFWDTSAYEAALAREATELEHLSHLGGAS